MAGKIELVLPGLFDLPPAEITPAPGTELKALNHILRLSTERSNRLYTIDAMVQGALALEPTAAEKPVGLALAQAQEAAADRPSERLLLFQAVHLRPDLHTAMFVPIQVNEINLDDISILINDLGDLFKVDCDIEEIADGIYLMELREFDAPLHYPHPLSVMGKAANPYIEQSRRDLEWYKLLNEMQMFLHQHEVNQRRLRDELLPINSLWFWGGGVRPGYRANGIACFCDDRLISRFLRDLNLSTAALADISGLDAGVDALVIDLRLLEMLKTGIASDIESLLRDLDENLLQPLLRLQQRDRRRLLLRAGFEFDFELGPFSALRFWRAARGLGDWIESDSAP